ncbi:MAG TPA: Sb-PDE family phosphodiesterase [Acidobacteriota bacterium]|nr:Sb-PDE family phosphodiesterase [Acidobacteriota bacterium]
MRFLTERKRHLRLALLSLVLVTFLAVCASGQVEPRREIGIPDIPGYLTLMCDFHMHTVFSDGYVWPMVRVQEAWRDGLDVFSITDHIEYQPHSEDIPTKHNRPYEIAAPAADALGLLIIKGAEITRQKPPGHFNALFLDDAALLEQDDFKEAVKAAIDQGAFVLWNHPGWPDNDETWYPIHSELYEAGWLHGIEVVNGNTYYPEAHKWSIEKKLTIFGNSDVHDPIDVDYDPAAGEHRPATLVFATERSLDAIKEALKQRRTAIYTQDKLIGEEQYLRPIYDASVEVLTTEVELQGRMRNQVMIRNSCEVPLYLELANPVEDISIPGRITLEAESTIVLMLRAASGEISAERNVEIPFVVTNFLVAPGKGLPVKLMLKVKFTPMQR